MGEDLERVNREFSKLFENINKKKKIDNKTKYLLYFFFISGYNQGGASEGIIV